MYCYLRGITKVTGEVDMSFATSFLQQLSSHDALVFRLSNIDNVERLQHNRNLVTLCVCVCVYFQIPYMVALKILTLLMDYISIHQ